MKEYHIRKGLCRILCEKNMMLFRVGGQLHLVSEMKSIVYCHA